MRRVERVVERVVCSSFETKDERRKTLLRNGDDHPQCSTGAYWRAVWEDGTSAWWRRRIGRYSDDASGGEGTGVGRPRPRTGGRVPGPRPVRGHDAFLGGNAPGNRLERAAGGHPPGSGVIGARSRPRLESRVRGDFGRAASPGGGAVRARGQRGQRVLAGVFADAARVSVWGGGDVCWDGCGVCCVLSRSVCGRGEHCGRAVRKLHRGFGQFRSRDCGARDAPPLERPGSDGGG